jgi:hypothetical protein
MRRPRPEFGCYVTEKNGFRIFLRLFEVGGGRGILKSSGGNKEVCSTSVPVGKFLTNYIAFC